MITPIDDDFIGEDRKEKFEHFKRNFRSIVDNSDQCVIYIAFRDQIVYTEDRGRVEMIRGDYEKQISQD